MGKEASFVVASMTADLEGEALKVSVTTFPPQHPQKKTSRQETIEESP